DEGFAVQSRGDLEAAFSQAAAVVEARYEVPFLAHAAMEPPNATAWLRDGWLTVWAPTQAPGPALRAAIETSGLPSRKVDLERTFVGGGFGRGLEVDIVRHAVRAAMAVPGRPVQVLWSREQDLAHDYYRPAFAARFAAALDRDRRASGWRPRTAGDAVGLHLLSANGLDRDAPVPAPSASRRAVDPAIGVPAPDRDGRVSGWRLRAAGDSVVLNWLSRNWLDVDAPVPDTSSSEGLFDQAYEVPARRVEHVRVRSDIPVGNWRSVGHSHNAF